MVAIVARVVFQCCVGYLLVTGAECTYRIVQHQHLLYQTSFHSISGVIRSGQVPREDPSCRVRVCLGFRPCVVLATADHTTNLWRRLGGSSPSKAHRAALR